MTTPADWLGNSTLTRTDPTIFIDARVRQALSLGIDRNRYAREIFNGFFRPDVPGTILQPDLLLDGLKNPEYQPDEKYRLGQSLQKGKK